MITILSVEFLGSYSGTGKEQVIMHLICDTFEELASFTSDRYEPLQGSVAHIVSNQLDYEMMSDGTWVVKQTADLQMVITSISNLENEMTSVHSDIDILTNQVGELHDAVEYLIDNGAKNLISLDPNVYTTGNVRVEIKSNGTIDVTLTSGTTANTTFSRAIKTITDLRSNDFVLSGCPSGGNYSNGYALYVTNDGITAEKDEGAGVLVPKNTTVTTSYLALIVRSGTAISGTLTFMPMICTEAAWKISHAYAPYAPTNRALYELIRGYHP